MKILQITPKVPYPPKDGGAIAILSLAAVFAKTGHHVTILCVNTPKHYFHITEIPAKYKDNIKFKSVYINTNTNPFKLILNLLFSSNPYIATRFYTNKFKKELLSLLKSQSFDVIQLEGIYLSSYIDDIKKVVSTPVVLRAHNVEHEIWYRNALMEKNILKKWYMKNLAKRVKKYEKSVINQYDILLPITSKDAEFFQNNGNSKPCRVIPFSIDIKDHPLQKQADKKKLFFIGALDWLPNQEGLLWFLENVWHNVKHQATDLEFHVAGRNAPEKLVRSLKNHDIVYHGEVEDAEKFCQDKGIMVVPLFSGSGMRVKIIEGMARGKIILTTSLGMEGIPAINRQHLMTANDEQEFIKAILRVTREDSLYNKLWKNSRVLVKENFDIFMISTGLIHLYETILHDN